MLPHERTHAGPKEGRLRPAARDAHAARADLPALRRRPAGRAARRRAADWRSTRAACGRASGGSTSERARARRAAPDRRRPPPLRDRGRLPRGGAVGDAHLRRARLVALAGARDLSDPPDRRAASASSPFGLHDLDLGHELARRSTSDGNFFRLDSDDELDTREIERYEPRGRRVHAGRRSRRSRPSTRERAAARVPRPRAVGRAGVRVRAARRDDAAEVDVLLPEAHLRPPAPSRSDGALARAVPRRRRGREGRARARCRRATSASGRSARARAATSPPRSTRRPRGPCSPTSTVADVRIVSEEIGIKGDGRDHGRRRPDRRLAERRARRSRTSRSPSRSPRARHDGRRRLRLRLRLRRERGVDGGARRRRVPERRAAHRRAEGPHRVPLDRGDAGRRSCSSSCASSRRSPTASGSWARRRSRSATSPPGRTDAVVCLKPSRSVDLAACQLLVRERGFCDPRDRRAGARHAPARPRGAVADLRGADARAGRRKSPQRYAPRA